MNNEQSNNNDEPNSEGDGAQQREEAQDALRGGDRRLGGEQLQLSLAAFNNIQNQQGNFNSLSAYLHLLLGQHLQSGPAGIGDNRGFHGDNQARTENSSSASIHNLLRALNHNPALASAPSIQQQSLPRNLQSNATLNQLTPALQALFGQAIGRNDPPTVPSNLDLEAARIASANAAAQQLILGALSQTSLQQEHLMGLLRSSNPGLSTNLSLNQNVLSSSSRGSSHHNNVPSSLPSWLAAAASGVGSTSTFPGASSSPGRDEVAPARSHGDIFLGGYSQGSSTRTTTTNAVTSERSVDNDATTPGSAVAAAASSSSLSTDASRNRNRSSDEEESLVLYMEGDENSLTEYQCLLRKQLEIFEAGPKDVRSSSQGRNTPILLGQVGLRCRHCAPLPVAARTKGAIYYSQTIDGIYQIAQNMSKVHLCERCYRIPPDIQRRLVALRSDCRRASGGKEYWADGIRSLGVYEDGNILRMRRKKSSSS